MVFFFLVSLGRSSGHVWGQMSISSDACRISEGFGISYDRNVAISDVELKLHTPFLLVLSSYTSTPPRPFSFFLFLFLSKYSLSFFCQIKYFICRSWYREVASFPGRRNLFLVFFLKNDTTNPQSKRFFFFFLNPQPKLYFQRHVNKNSFIFNEFYLRARVRCLRKYKRYA